MTIVRRRFRVILFVFGLPSRGQNRLKAVLDSELKVKTKCPHIGSIFFTPPWSRLPRARASLSETTIESLLKSNRLYLRSLRGVPEGPLQSAARRPSYLK